MYPLMIILFIHISIHLSIHISVHYIYIYLLKDIASRRCKHCACSVCGGKDQPDKQLLCDECDNAFHLWCLNPSR